MTNQEAIKLLSMGRLAYNEVEAKAFCEAYNMAIEALKKEPCGDCISRQAVTNCFKKWQPYMATRLFDFEKELSELPPVTPPEKVGWWISTETKGVRYAFWCRYKCSLCGELSDRKNYCPNCGAKMQEVEE